MILTDIYQVTRLTGKADIIINVPGSKSITNRALILAALSHRRCVLEGVLFSEDSRAVLDCLNILGFEPDIDEARCRVTLQGCGGKIPNRQAVLHVGNAGTAARFLTVMLALAGGDYRLEAGEQMKKRPMEPLLSILRGAGAGIICLEEEGHFPFRLTANRLTLPEVTVDTDVSSQFASALLMAGILLPEGLTVNLTGSRTAGSYIGITLKMMEQFGLRVVKDGQRCHVYPAAAFGLPEYRIEPDLSGACYFYSLAPLLGVNVLVKNVRRDSLQGDIQFIGLLENLGCVTEETEAGLWVKGNGITDFPGIDADMKDFSDQTMTAAVLAPFARTESWLRNIGHIRYQESDRMLATTTELTRLGIRCEITDSPRDGSGIRIWPGPIKGGTVETYEDHRMAMAFALIGLKTGNLAIRNPACCGKTFENYFELLTRLTESDRTDRPGDSSASQQEDEWSKKKM